MHKWWARRLGSVFRAIILYSLKEGVRPDVLLDLYSSDVDLSDKVIFDPMMGGGTTVVEALRFGCKVIAGDLNPVAWYIVKKQIEDIDTTRVLDAMGELEKELGKELRKYYKTTCPVCNNSAEAMYFFHCKEIDCPDCGQQVPLIPSYYLAASPVGNGDIVICPSCWDVFDTPSAKDVAQCQRCGTSFVATETSCTEGQDFICPNGCLSKKIVDLITPENRPETRIYAIEYYCNTCNKSRAPVLKRGRGYKATDDKDKMLLKAANEEFERISRTLPIPDTKIPLGVETQRAINHGYLRFRDMFNKRQLLNLGKIFGWILKLEDWGVKELLILAFSNSLKYNNMFCKYNGTRGFITDIFRTHSFSPSMAPVEANCYDTTRGRGSFTAFVNLIVEGKEYCQAPFERVPAKEGMTKVQLEAPIEGRIVEDYSLLGNMRNTYLMCGPSKSTDIPDKIVDAVVTDPPYADNVMYSELSNFFYVWLRIALSERYEYFKEILVPSEEEVIENRVQEKGKDEYLEGLTGIFIECNRVLKDSGILVFTFHHKRIEAWSSVLQAVLDAGFYIKATYPVRSEMKASTHLYDMDNITMDIVLVCKKRTRNTPSEWSSIAERIVRSTKESIKRFECGEHTPTALDRLVMLLGHGLQMYSEQYPDVLDNGRAVGVHEALYQIRDIASSMLEE